MPEIRPTLSSRETNPGNLRRFIHGDRFPSALPDRVSEPEMHLPTRRRIRQSLQLLSGCDPGYDPGPPDGRIYVTVVTATEEIRHQYQPCSHEWTLDCQPCCR